jgi:hypothetical protein
VSSSSLSPSMNSDIGSGVAGGGITPTSPCAGERGGERSSSATAWPPHLGARAPSGGEGRGAGGAALPRRHMASCRVCGFLRRGFLWRLVKGAWLPRGVKVVDRDPPSMGGQRQDPPCDGVATA